MDTSLKEALDINYDIVFVAYIYLNSSGEYFSGGAEIHLRNIAAALSSNKKIMVLCKGDEDQIIKRDGITIVTLKASNRTRYLFRLRKISSSLKTARVHFNYLDLQIFNTKKKGVVYSATFHGVGWDFPIKSKFPDFVADDMLHKAGSLYIKAKAIYKQVSAVSRLDKVLSVDTSLVRFTQQFQTSSRTKISTIFNFVDLDAFRRTVRVKNSKFIILYPRNISYARGAQLLVPIAKILKANKVDFEIQLLGAGIEEIGGNKYEKLLHRDIEANDLSGNFKFLGRVAHGDMPQYFTDASIVLIPTYFSEGTSLSCLEAMASGRSVIATNIGGLNDLIINNYNGVLVQPLAEDIAAALLKAYKNPDASEVMAERAYSIVADNYSFVEWSKKVNSFFT